MPLTHSLTTDSTQMRITAVEPRDEKMCAICLGDLTPDWITHLGNGTNQCWHSFCKNCMEMAMNSEWREHGRVTCPMCRGQLTDENLIRQFTIEFVQESVTIWCTVGLLAKNWSGFNEEFFALIVKELSAYMIHRKTGMVMIVWKKLTERTTESDMTLGSDGMSSSYSPMLDYRGIGGRTIRGYLREMGPHRYSLLILDDIESLRYQRRATGASGSAQG